MPTRKTLILLAVLLAFLLLALRFGNRHLGDGRPLGAPPATLLPRVGAPAVSLSVSNASVQVSATRSGARWVLAPPAGGRADAARVQLVVDAVAGARVSDRVSASQRERRGLSMRDYGLDRPRASVAVGWPRETVRVEFGADAPGGERVFARVAGSDDVYAVDREAFDALPLQLDDLRDRVLFTQPGRDICAVEIRRPARRTVRLAETAPGTWRLSEPFDCPAAPEAVVPLLAALRTTVADRFVWSPPPDAPSSDAGLVALGLAPDEASLSLSVWSRGSAEPLSFTFGAEDATDASRVYAASLADNVVCTVDRTVLDALLMPFDLLRDRRLFPFPKEKLLGLSADSPRGSVRVARENPGAPWTIAAPGVQPADAEAADAFAEALLSLRDTVLEPLPEESSPEATDPEAFRVTLAPAPPLEPVTVLFTARPGSRPDSTDLVATFPGRGFRQVVEDGGSPARWFSFEALAPLRDLSVLALPGGAVAALTRREPGGADQTVRREPDGTWIAAHPARETPERAAADALAALLADFRADATATLWTPDSASFGLLPPRLETVVTTTLLDRPVVILQLGAERPGGGCYLRVKGSDEVFAVGPDAAAVLSAPLTRPKP